MRQLLAILGVCALVPLLPADCHHVTYAAPIKHQAYAHVQYSQAYYPPALLLQVSPNYYSVQDHYRDVKLKEAEAKYLEAQAALMQAQTAGLVQAFKIGQASQQPPPAPPGPPLQPLPPGPQMPNALPLVAPAPQDDASLIVAEIHASCIKCHSGTEAKKGFRLDGPLTVPQATKAMRRVVAGTMPPTGPLTEERKDLFEKLVVKLCSK